MITRHDSSGVAGLVTPAAAGDCRGSWDGGGRGHAACCVADPSGRGPPAVDGNPWPGARTARSLMSPERQEGPRICGGPDIGEAP